MRNLGLPFEKKMNDFPGSLERLFIYLPLYGTYGKILLHSDFLWYVNVWN